MSDDAVWTWWQMAKVCSCVTMVCEHTPKPAIQDAPEAAKMPGESVSQWIDRVYPLNTEQAAIDRALDDFTARRKAKREQSDIEAFFEGSQWAEHLDSYPKQNEELARALSTPLPHDPPLSVRLLPWRGKE